MEIQIHLLDLLTKKSCSEKYNNIGPMQESQGRRLDFYCQRPIVVSIAAVPG